MGSDFKTIQDFIKNNKIQSTYAYRDNGKTIDLDTLIKRKEFKRRSTISAVMLNDNHTVDLSTDYSGINVQKLNGRYALVTTAIGYNRTYYSEDNPYDYWESQYALLFDHTLYDLFRTGDYEDKVYTLKNVYEFSCDGGDLIILYFNRKAYLVSGHIGRNLYLIGDSVIDIASGGPKKYKEDKKSLEKYEGESSFVLGVSLNGKVIFKGNGSNGREAVSEWEDIIAVDAFDTYAVGLTRYGTVLAAGVNDNNRCNVGAWKGIVDIAASENMTLGLRSDGTVVCTAKIPGIESLKNVVGVSGSLCVKDDGSLAYISKNGVQHYPNLKLWYAKRIHGDALRAQWQRSKQLRQKRHELLEEMNATTGFFAKRRKETLQMEIKEIDKEINDLGKGGYHLAL